MVSNWMDIDQLHDQHQHDGHLHGDRLDGLTGGHRSAAVDHLHLVQQPGRNSSCFTFFEKPILIFYIFYLVVFICCFRFPFDVEGLFI